VNNLPVGKSGENIAASYLIKKGYKILVRNFRTKIGEIDIVAKEKDTLVFVEVKTRKSDISGTGAEAITKKKLNSIIKTAYYFLRKFPQKCDFRIDAIEIQENARDTVAINHIKNITL